MELNKVKIYKNLFKSFLLAGAMIPVSLMADLNDETKALLSNAPGAAGNAFRTLRYYESQQFTEGTTYGNIPARLFDGAAGVDTTPQFACYNGIYMEGAGADSSELTRYNIQEAWLNYKSAPNYNLQAPNNNIYVHPDNNRVIKPSLQSIPVKNGNPVRLVGGNRQDAFEVMTQMISNYVGQAGSNARQAYIEKRKKGIDAVIFIQVQGQNQKNSNPQREQRMTAYVLGTDYVYNVASPVCDYNEEYRTFRLLAANVGLSRSIGEFTIARLPWSQVQNRLNTMLTAAMTQVGPKAQADVRIILAEYGNPEEIEEINRNFASELTVSDGHRLVDERVGGANGGTQSLSEMRRLRLARFDNHTQVRPKTKPSSKTSDQVRKGATVGQTLSGGSGHTKLTPKQVREQRAKMLSDNRSEAAPKPKSSDSEGSSSTSSSTELLSAVTQPAESSSVAFTATPQKDAASQSPKNGNRLTADSSFASEATAQSVAEVLSPEDEDAIALAFKELNGDAGQTQSQSGSNHFADVAETDDDRFLRLALEVSRMDTGSTHVRNLENNAASNSTISRINSAGIEREARELLAGITGPGDHLDEMVNHYLSLDEEGRAEYLQALLN